MGMSFTEKLKERRKAQEEVGATGASEKSVKRSQEAAKAFEKSVTEEKKRKGQNSNSKMGYSY